MVTIATGNSPKRSAAFAVFQVGLFGGFVVVALYTLVALRPQAIRTIEVDRYDPYLDDFVVYYSASDVALDGDGGHVYELARMREAEATAVGWPTDRTYTLPFFNPPPVLLPLVPLALLPLSVAAVVWLALNAAAGLAATLLLIRQSQSSLLPWLGPTVAAGILSSPPFFQVAIHGQTTLVLALGFVLLWIGLYDRRKDSILISSLLILILKPQLLALPLVVAAVHGRWRALAIWASVAASLYALAAMIFGPNIVLDHVHLMRQASTWREENGVSVWGMFGWNAFIEALLKDAPDVYKWLFTSLLSGFTLVACSAVIWLRRDRLCDTITFSAVSFGAVLISPHLYQHDVLLVVPALWLVMVRGQTMAFCSAVVVGLLMWLLAQYHFDLLTATNLNFTTLTMGLVVLALALIACTAPTASPARTEQTRRFLT